MFECNSMTLFKFVMFMDSKRLHLNKIIYLFLTIGSVTASVFGVFDFFSVLVLPRLFSFN